MPQVSHHPPVSAFHVSNRKDGFCISGSVTAKSRFYGEGLPWAHPGASGDGEDWAPRFLPWWPGAWPSSLSCSGGTWVGKSVSIPPVRFTRTKPPGKVRSGPEWSRLAAWRVDPRAGARAGYKRPIASTPRTPASVTEMNVSTRQVP